MADKNFRGFRSDPFARDSGSMQNDAMSDPLAELARLIGQSDAPSGRRRDADRASEEFDEAPAALDWGVTDQEYAQQAEAEPSYSPQPAVVAPWLRGRAHDDESTGARPYVRPFAGYAEGTQSRAPARRTDSLPYVPQAHGGYLADDHGQLGTQPADFYDAPESQDEEYEESPPVRRSGTVILVAVLGLAVLGTAGAMGYRAMFGGPMIPSLPPIIKPSDTPVKIVPKHDGPVGSLSQTDAGQKGGDKLVTHEEQPVDLQSAAPVPHIVTTIPVVSNASDAPLPGNPDATQPGGPSPSPFDDSNNPPQQFGVAMPSASAESVPDQSLPGSKPVRTVTILPQQRPASAQEPAPPPPVETRSAQIRRSGARPIRDQRTASLGPLSIMPGQTGQVEPPPAAKRPRATVARDSDPMSLTSDVRTPDEVGRGGGYAVQVTSQRSEAGAQAAFRSLQARFPKQLGGQHAFVRRADLGAKGVYYRALIGPFASAEKAASLCSSLKTAGGSCLIQRN